MRAIDLYAGAGGWDVALERMGIEAGGVEIMPEAIATREAAGLTTIHDDVWTLGDHQLAWHDMQVASPPCQTFSLAGKGAGRKAMDDVLGALWQGAYRTIEGLRDLSEQVGDERTGLVLTPLHYALRYQPTHIAWEQVPTVLPIWQACAEVLEEHGYSTWTGLLHAEQYGVPQTRKRAFLMASLEGQVAPPTPTRSKYHPRDPGRLDEGVLPWVSMAEALGFGMSGRPSPTVTGGGTETGGAEPIAHLRRYTGRDDWVPHWAVEPNGNEDWPYNRPSPTIIGSFAPDVVAAPGWRKAGDGPRQSQPGSVRVTVQEAGILQSFPADFPWQGSKTKQYLQVGNAIPVLLAEAVVRELISTNNVTLSKEAA